MIMRGKRLCLRVILLVNLILLLKFDFVVTWRALPHICNVRVHRYLIVSWGVVAAILLLSANPLLLV